MTAVAAISIRQPEWLAPFLSDRPAGFPDRDQRLRLTFELALENVRRGTGGPFAAAVFELPSGKLLAAAVNVVTPSGQSLAHAEMLALGGAERLLGSHRLANFDSELVASCEPCIMCLGGTLWSGVRHLVYGAPGDFARELGFDEGDKVPDWHERCRARNIEVIGPRLEEEARAPFREYRRNQGPLY